MERREARRIGRDGEYVLDDEIDDYLSSQESDGEIDEGKKAKRKRKAIVIKASQQAKSKPISTDLAKFDIYGRCST